MHQVRNREKIGLNQSLIYIHPFPPLSPNFYFLSLFNIVAKIISWVEKILGGRGEYPPRHYAYAVV